jgi:hypothetical protein
MIDITNITNFKLLKILNKSMIYNIFYDDFSEESSKRIKGAVKLVSYSLFFAPVWLPQITKQEYFF